ncbi:unnamed protein product [Paramecium primaurelia]|uniref:Chitinase domain-containing protein 1 n=1 Tax=Paramecium primaurelia TaxID=5886 RepID=A0A8S1M4X2_PARPR|nr:unnamed protein product [Paramecium primaurelia]
MSVFNIALFGIIGAILLYYLYVSSQSISIPFELQQIQEQELEARQKESGNKNYQIPNFFFVTPWNKEGYRLTIKYAQKIDMVSPAWFSVRYNNVIDGKQVVNEQWMQEIVKANPSIAIIPRVQIELQESSFIQQINNPQLLETIINLVQQYQDKFHGIMIDTPYLSYIDAFDAQDIVKFLQKLKAKLNNKMLVLTLYGIYNPQQYKHSTLRKLFKIADYTLIQTYDYQIQDEDDQLLSPYQWVQDNLEHFMTYKEKLLFGIPFYGFKKTEHDKTHFIGNELLKLNASNFITEWDRSSSECRYKNELVSISYPCPDFLVYRLEIIKEFGRGYFVWEGGQGIELFYQLL